MSELNDECACECGLFFHCCAVFMGEGRGCRLRLRRSGRAARCESAAAFESVFRFQSLHLKAYFGFNRRYQGTLGLALQGAKRFSQVSVKCDVCMSRVCVTCHVCHVSCESMCGCSLGDCASVAGQWQGRGT